MQHKKYISDRRKFEVAKEMKGRYDYGGKKMKLLYCLQERQEKREQGIVSMAEPQSTKEPSDTKAL